MNTTETIVAELEKELAGCHPVADFQRIKDCRQLINAYETLARLRAECAVTPSDGLAAQIGFWLRQVPRDVVAPVEAPKRFRRGASAEPSKVEAE